MSLNLFSGERGLSGASRWSKAPAGLFLATLFLGLAVSSAVAQQPGEHDNDPAPAPSPAAVNVPTGDAAAKADAKAEAKKEEKEKVKLGIIASQGKFADNTNIESDSVGAVPGDDIGMITGAIARKSRSECIARLQNAGKKSYSVSFEVIGTNKAGSKVLSRSFSGTIRPNSFFERNVSGCRDDLNLQVNLRSAKPL